MKRTARIVWWIVCLSLALGACAPRTTPIVPTAPALPQATTTVTVHPTETVNPAGNSRDLAITDAWSAWITAWKAATNHIYDFGDRIPDWVFPDAGSAEGKLRAYCAWRTVLPPPVDGCSGDAFAVVAAKQGDPSRIGITLSATALRDWQTTDQLPYEGDVRLDRCNYDGGATSPFRFLSRITLVTPDGRSQLYMPTFGIITYGGESYRLPASCMSDEAIAMARPKAAWYGDDALPMVDMDTLRTMYGWIVPATVVAVYPGDPSVVVEINATRYLVTGGMDVMDGDELYDPFSDGLDGPDTVIPGSGRLLIGWSEWSERYKGCFQYRAALPQSTTELTPERLEGTEITGTVESACIGVLVTLPQGSLYLYRGEVTSWEYPESYAFGPVTGFAHYEEGMLYVTRTPRDTARDARIAELVGRLVERGYDVKLEGPIVNAETLKQSWFLLPGMTPALVEYLTGEPMPYFYKYRLTAELPVGSWTVLVAQYAPRDPDGWLPGNYGPVFINSSTASCSDEGFRSYGFTVLENGEAHGGTVCAPSGGFIMLLPASAMPDSQTGDIAADTVRVYRIP